MPTTTAEPLYQENPRSKSRCPSLISTSFTESKESYMKAARQESWILENCGRVPNLEIVLRYFVPLTLDVIRKNWARIRINLKKAGITFAAAVEFTVGDDGRPNNCLHYHFLIDTKMDRDDLTKVMKNVCQKSKIGVYGQDFDLIFPNKGIQCWGTKKINYFTKYGHKDKIHMFRTGLRFKKFYYSKDWFIESDGTRTTKTKILKQLKEKYKRKKARVGQ
jgi:hypothetical protein